MSILMNTEIADFAVRFRERDNAQDAWAKIEGRRDSHVRRSLWRRQVRTETTDN